MARIYKKKLGSGRIVWQLSHGSPPNRVRFVAGHTREEAEATLRLFERQVGLHGSAPDSITVAEAVAKYRAFLEVNRSKSTQRRYGRVLMTFAECFLPSFFPKLELLRDVRPAHLEAYKVRRLAGEISEEEDAQAREREAALRQELEASPKTGSPKANAKFGWLGRKRLAEKVSKRTINYELQTLGGFFRWAIKQNLLFLNPIETVELFRLPRASAPKFMTADELDAFFRACSDYERRVFSILLLTGMRKGEIEHLEWEDVRLDLGVIFIQAKEDWQPKTNERVIPISPALQAILVEHYEARRSDRFVIANRAGNRQTHLLSKVKKVCRRAGIKPLAATVHALRHSFGAHLRMAGTPLATIADLMGHADLSTTQIYAKVQIGHLRDAASRLAPLVPAMAPENGTRADLDEADEPKVLTPKQLRP